MLHYAGKKIRGVIFDVDETMLDNHPEAVQHNGYPAGTGAHEISRQMAAQQLRGGRYVRLAALTLEECTQAFNDAREHSLHGAVWQMLRMSGVVQGDLENNRQHPLLLEMCALKDELHADVLRTHGKPVPGVVPFVDRLATLGIPMAIASTSYRRDVDIFLHEITTLGKHFPEERIITREKFTRTKPDPESFQLAFTSLKLPPSDRGNVLVFEDDPRGIKGAAGFMVCGITTRHSAEELRRQDPAPAFCAPNFVGMEELLAA